MDFVFNHIFKGIKKPEDVNGLIVNIDKNNIPEQIKKSRTPSKLLFSGKENITLKIESLENFTCFIKFNSYFGTLLEIQNLLSAYFIEDYLFVNSEKIGRGNTLTISRINNLIEAFIDNEKVLDFENKNKIEKITIGSKLNNSNFLKGIIHSFLLYDCFLDFKIRSSIESGLR